MIRTIDARDVYKRQDAVYMGGSKFGARAYAQNPEGKILLDAIDYAHLYGVKLYLTVNTLLKDQELEQELYEYLKPCYEHGLDAVLVQDLGCLLYTSQCPDQRDQRYQDCFKSEI